MSTVVGIQPDVAHALVALGTGVGTMATALDLEDVPDLLADQAGVRTVAG